MIKNKLCFKKYFYFFSLTFLLINCQGYLTEKEPIHINPNMDFQSKMEAQKLSLKIPKETIPWGNTISDFKSREQFLKKNTSLYEGKISKNGPYIKKIPLKVNKKFILRGQERFNIYCATCHDRSGTGNSMIVKRGMVQPPNLSDKRIINMADGELFSIITSGIRNMSGYGKKIKPEDRWTIISYLRALQFARNASMTDVPVEKRKELLNKNLETN